ncbi:MAG: cupin domain-containing protein [Myxococcaceae bacterium]|nr:cupin domain-containing protein [Myxococcaceae bacterium]
MSDVNAPDDLLADYVLGTLSVVERARVDEALRQSPSLVESLRELEDAMRLVGVGLEAPKRPWAKVEQSLSGGRRFEHLVPKVAELFDVDEAAARALVESIDGAEGWGEGPAPGVMLLPVAAGPRCDGFMTALVRLEPGAQLPFHRHADRERVLVLEGGYRDDQSGSEFWRGELDVREDGSSHSFTALEGVPCICASVAKLGEDG